MPFFTDKKIEFLLLDQFEEIDLYPLPAVKSFPNWIKNMDTNSKLKSVRQCPPFLDAMSLGYIIPAWQDFKFEKTENSYRFSAQHTYIHSPIEISRSVCEFQYPVQYKNSPFENHFVIKIQTPWIIKTPKQYSLLIISPLNHYNNKIEAISAVIDTDIYTPNFGFTCIVRNQDKCFEIKKGEPLAQIIPIRRQRWHSLRSIGKTVESSKIGLKLKSQIESGYKKLFWNKKEYL